MPSIIITPWGIDSIDPKGTVLRVRQLFFEKDGKYRNLHDGQCFDAEGSLQVLYLERRWSRSHLIPLTIPASLLEATAIFLSEYHGKEHTLDCYDFANMVAGVPLHDKSLLYGYWQERRRFVRRPGDVIFLVKKKECHFRHAAVYLGHGLYISVYGKNGDIEVANLSDMKRDYGARDVLTVVPRVRT